MRLFEATGMKLERGLDTGEFDPTVHVVPVCGQIILNVRSL